jgi:hypothetical protein
VPEGAGLRKTAMRSERCAAVIRTSLGCCMRCAQSAAGESPPNPKVQHVHYDTGPRVTGNRRACGCCGALARKRPVLQISRGFCTQNALKKRDNDSPPPQRSWACRACVYSSTNAPTAIQWNVSAGQKRARASSPSRSVAKTEQGGRPDKTVQARAHRADSANIPQGIQ